MGHDQYFLLIDLIGRRGKEFRLAHAQGNVGGGWIIHAGDDGDIFSACVQVAQPGGGGGGRVNSDNLRGV
jgi:hypothetical protein